ncbi:MAG: hypothetical protein PHP53_00445 [Prolixibacteraceae bacterium]|nr:hypothetical protein [Prolixibacteraceae bacterium]
MKSYFNWFSKPLFYVVAGLLFMIPVIWIARTGAFYLCYFPLIIAAILFSGTVIPEKKVTLPSILTRYFGFVSGMIISELIFSLILIASNELSVQFKSTQSGWLILSIELVLGIAVFMLFFSISIAARYFYRRISSKY